MNATDTTHRRRRLVVAALAATALLIGACSPGGGDGEVEVNEGTDEQALVDNATFVGEGFLDGDADQVYELMSERCRDEQSLEEIEAFVAGGEAVDTSLEEVEVTGFETDTATVSYSFGVPALDIADSPWILEDAGWRFDSC